MSIKCGIYMTPKKRPKFDEFVTYAREQGIDMVDLNLDGAMRDLPQDLDCILHKITDDYAKSGRDEVCRGRMKHWNALLEMNKRAVLIDPMEGILPVLKRSSMMEMLQQLSSSNNLPFSTPSCTSLTAADILSHKVSNQGLKALGLRPPFLCKLDAACGVDNAHIMTVFDDVSQLKEDLSGECSIQNFINHGGVIWKVYVIGEHFYILPRPSLEDVGNDTELPYSFNSQKSCAFKPNGAQQNLDGPKDEDVRQLNNIIRQKLGLTLYGVDIIIETG
mmetsp:Transcript_35351/g.110506  ORF Transcript_35351/g.110506 Transcript_35351/m.110506 type:complete len:276 (-) Transcript_35351:1113-1940(-)